MWWAVVEDTGRVVLLGLVWYLEVNGDKTARGANRSL